MIKPMLAHKYSSTRVVYPCFVQPKLNGVRGLYLPNRHFQSRYGEIWTPSVVHNALMALTRQPFVLDGEFYKHGMSLQQINSRIGVVRKEPHEESAEIKFYIFDVIVDEPFYRRALILRKLKSMFDGDPAIGVVKTEEVTSPVEADHLYNKWRNLEGFEGMMYRDANAHYGFASRCGNKDNRWHCLLKRKEMQDLDAVVIGLQQMVAQTGELKDTLGAFELRAENGAVFTAGSGLTDVQRNTYWAAGENMLGTRVKIRFEMLSDGGVPLKPIIDLVEYEQ
jgi:ATP-dependent DNA ligase